MAGRASGVDLVVIGGGVIGLSIGWRAAGLGMSVSVADPDPGRGASWAAAGMLAPVTEVRYGDEELLGPNLESARRWPAFADELQEASGHHVGYRPVGTLAVARDSDDWAQLRRLAAFQHQLGLASQLLGPGECRSAEPCLAPGIRGGLWVEGDHQVDSRAVVEALLQAMGGPRVVREAVTGLQARGRRVTGVVLADGSRVGAGTVVLAAGAWSASLGGLPPGVLPPVRPVKGHILRLTGQVAVPLLSHNVRGLVAGSEVYLVPRASGEVVVGATVEEMGFDVTVRAGAVRQLLRDACELVPGVDELELVEAGTGLRPGSPDNVALVGPAQLEGLVLATGHFRNGYLLCPLTADAVAGFLASGEWEAAVDPLRPSRLGDGPPAPSAASRAQPGRSTGPARAAEPPTLASDPR